MHKVIAVLILAILTLSPPAMAWQEPARGTPTRAALLDALRPHAGWQYGYPIEFLVYDLRVEGNLAFASVGLQRPGGGRIDLRQTPSYARGNTYLDDDNTDWTTMQALFVLSGQTWVAVHHVLGAGDVWWSEPELCQIWRPVVGEVC
ncbi:MAG: hypothetical protein AB8B51_05005 [Sedimentitalea sp.]